MYGSNITSQIRLANIIKFVTAIFAYPLHKQIYVGNSSVLACKFSMAGITNTLWTYMHIEDHHLKILVTICYSVTGDG